MALNIIFSAICLGSIGSKCQGGRMKQSQYWMLEEGVGGGNIYFLYSNVGHDMCLALVCHNSGRRCWGGDNGMGFYVPWMEMFSLFFFTKQGLKNERPIEAHLCCFLGCSIKACLYGHLAEVSLF